jgi:response regulator NasT
MDGIDAAARIYQERPVPVILVSAYHDQELIARAEADHILGYLVKPIKQTDLAPVIALAMRRFEQFETLQREAANLRQALEDRKVIERAKGILMKRGPMDEPEAFRRLQKMASERSSKLVEIARMIVITEQALQPPS